MENLDDEARVNKLKVHKKTLQDRIAILDALDQEILNSLGEDGDLEKEIVDSGEFNGVVHELSRLLWKSKLLWKCTWPWREIPQAPMY